MTTTTQQLKDFDTKHKAKYLVAVQYDDLQENASGTFVLDREQKELVNLEPDNPQGTLYQLEHAQDLLDIYWEQYTKGKPPFIHDKYTIPIYCVILKVEYNEKKEQLNLIHFEILPLETSKNSITDREVKKAGYTDKIFIAMERAVNRYYKGKGEVYYDDNNRTLKIKDLT